MGSPWTLDIGHLLLASPCSPCLRGEFSFGVFRVFSELLFLLSFPTNPLTTDITAGILFSDDLAHPVCLWVLRASRDSSEPHHAESDKRRTAANNCTSVSHICAYVHLCAVACTCVRKNEEFQKCAQTAHNRTFGRIRSFRDLSGLNGTYRDHKNVKPCNFATMQPRNPFQICLIINDFHPDTRKGVQTRSLT